MIEFNWDTSSKLIIIGLILSALVIAMTINSGCITQGKTLIKDALATPTPTPSPEPTPTPSPEPTPEPTPKSIETLAAHYVDPYMTGERWEGQWFKWLRYDVQGEKDLEIGILAYRHAYLDKYTWWNAALGNYQTQLPSEGNRYFVAWVHEEMLGVNSTYDPSMWIFDERAFRLQVKDNLYEVDASHNPVNRIKEFDTKYDYYNTVTAGPFGWDLRYTGNSPETAGYTAERRGWIRMGKGNAIDGYLLFEVPKSTMDEDVALIGSFSSFGSAYWRFTR
jgi:hypothetical protein